MLLNMAEWDETLRSKNWCDESYTAKHPYFTLCRCRSARRFATRQLHQYEPGQTGQYQPFAHGILRLDGGGEHLGFIGAQLSHQVIDAIAHIVEAG